MRLGRRIPFRTLATTAAVVVVAAACYPPVPAGTEFVPRWAQAMSGGTNEDEFDGVAVAPDDSVYVTGKFEGSATLGGRMLTSAGAADIPFARFNAFGGPVWVQRFGGSGEDNLFDIDADAAGAVATGWFAGTVAFGAVTLTSQGPSDCVVLALRPDGSTRWARRLGGPGRDGCNEVTVGPGGTVTTSIDTQGGWTPTGGAPLPALAVAAADTVLVRLAAEGAPQWMRAVGGPGRQRGKSLAVAPDGAVSFGGDTVGALALAGRTVTAPTAGASADAWLSRWSPSGALQWVDAWGGPGDDLAKGVVDDGRAVSYGGPFTGVLTVGATTLDAGAQPDTLVAQRSLTGAVRWATSVRAVDALGGVEVVGTPHGGMLFGGAAPGEIRFGSTAGPGIELDRRPGGIAWLAQYRADGTPRFARTIAGTAFGNVGELARRGARVYLDVTLRGQGNTINGDPIPTRGKDASVWALDLGA